MPLSSQPVKYLQALLSNTDGQGTDGVWMGGIRLSISSDGNLFS